MAETLKALADLLLEAVPTILFFIVLAWYLKQVYFRPMAQLLEERRKATEGVRELAQQAYEAADQKQSEFERAMELARGELYKEHEKLRREWEDEQTQAIAEARAKVDEQIVQAKQQIAKEVDGAQAELDGQVEELSGRIVDSIAGRRAA